MFAESRSAARGAQQFLPLLRRPNTYTCQRKTGTFSSDNLQKSRRFSSKSPWYFCGSGVYSRSLVPLHLQMVFMSFSAIPQGFRDDGFSELDANEMKVDEGFKDAISKKVPSLTSIFSNPNVTRSVKSVISIPCGKNEKKSVNSVTSIPSEKRKKKSVNSVTPISSGKTEKKNVKSEQQQKTTPKTEKAKGGLDILQHPWPEWVQFLEHLNERGYLNKAFHYQWPIELRDLSTEGIYVFIKFAAFSFAEDHVEISKLSGSDLKKVALHRVPSDEELAVLAAKRLRSFYITEDDASLPIDMDETNNLPSLEVSEVKRLESEDVVRLLCAYGLNAEKSELPIPDDIKQSVVNLLKQLVDISTSSVNTG